MIAYFASLPVFLYSICCHKMGMNHDEEAVLFLDENAYKTRGLHFIPEELKKNHVFKDVVACKMILGIAKDMQPGMVETVITENYDQIFQKSGYNVESFEKIFTVNDNWEGYQAVYFNMKKIKYTWIQMAKNSMPVPGTGFGSGSIKVWNKYNAMTALAEYAEPCLADSSDITIKKMNERNKQYTVWNREDCYRSLTEEDMEKLYFAFHLNEVDFSHSSDISTVLVIKNSFGNLDSVMKKTKADYFFGDYSKQEICASMDMISLDFYAPQADKIFFKCHINDPLNETEIKRLYGENAVSLPNVPFEILARYFDVKKIKVNKVIGAYSAAVSTMNSNYYDELCVLGIDFAKTWWYYISLYTSLLFAKEQGCKQIFCNEVMLKQLELLAREIEYNVELLEVNKSIIGKIKNSFIINDMSVYGDLRLESVNKSNTVLFLNPELSNGFFPVQLKNMFVPIIINKDKIADTECDILYREEIIWLYSDNAQVKKAARNFTFEKQLKNCGMKIYSQKITLPQAAELFQTKRLKGEIQELRDVIEDQNQQIKILSEYITFPNHLENKLKLVKDIYMYLNILRVIKTKYLIVMAVRDTPGNCLPNDVIQKLFDIGFNKFNKELWKMYVGVSLKSTVLCNQVGEKREAPVEYAFDSCDLKLNVVSKAYREGNQASIVINGTDFAVNYRGLNIVVYDLDNQRLIDSVAFDAHTEEWKSVRN